MKNSFSALDALIKEETDVELDSEYEEGEMRQVSDLLSKAFSRQDGSFKTLREACAGSSSRADGLESQHDKFLDSNVEIGGKTVILRQVMY